MGAVGHTSFNMNMKIIFAIAIALTVVACKHDSDFSENVSPEEGLAEVGTSEESAAETSESSKASSKAKAGIFGWRRRRWVKVAENLIKKSKEILHKKVTAIKKAEMKAKEKKSKAKEVATKDQKEKAHKAHQKERKAKEKSEKEKGNKAFQAAKKAHNDQEAAKEKAWKNHPVEVCRSYTYYLKAKCTAHPLSWYTNCPKDRRSSWTRCGFMNLGGQYKCKHHKKECKMVARKYKKNYKKYKRADFSYKGTGVYREAPQAMSRKGRL